jgi:Fe-S-cluster containining protein
MAGSLTVTGQCTKSGAEGVERRSSRCGISEQGVSCRRRIASGSFNDLSNDSMSDKPWYHKGLRFACTACGACCTGQPGYVWVNKAEIAALAAAVGVAVEQFEKRYVRRIGIRNSLIEFPNGDCVFFSPNRRTCRVYAARPRQCQTWPFWESNLRSPDTWQQMACECPGANRGRLIPLRKIRDQLRVMRL